MSSIEFAQEKIAPAAGTAMGEKGNTSITRIAENDRLVKLKDVLDAIDKVSASLIDGAPSIDYKRGYDVAVRHIAAGVRKLDPVVMQDPEPVQPNPTPKASKSEPDDVWTLLRMICDREDCLPTAQEYVYETSRGRTYNVRVSIA
jgi:hypothetical protein